MRPLHIQEAYSFYKKFILDYARDKADIYEKYGFNLEGSVGSKDWEVFAAVLLGDRAKPGNGADLMNHEVKSAFLGNSFEYQYHKNRGLEKLEEDKAVDHIFVARGSDYADVYVWFVNRRHLIPIFDSWLPELSQNYLGGTRQRFRRSVSYAFVTTRGELLLEIRAGRLVYP